MDQSRSVCTGSGMATGVDGSSRLLGGTDPARGWTSAGHAILRVSGCEGLLHSLSGSFGHCRWEALGTTPLETCRGAPCRPFTRPLLGDWFVPLEFAGLYDRKAGLGRNLVVVGGGDALSALLNLFNLLPLGTLDGGQFCQTVLFSRFPRAEVVFRILGSLGLASLGLWMESPMLAAFAVLPVLTLRSSWDAASLWVALGILAREVGVPSSQDEAEARMDALLEEPRFAKISGMRRGLVRQMVVQELDPVTMPWWQASLFMALYLFLWSPVLLILVGAGGSLLMMGRSGG